MVLWIVTHVRISRCGHDAGQEHHPLFVLDGVPFGRDANGVVDQAAIDRIMGTLNPADVEDIEVVKRGAAMAACGVRGDDGAILIRTKRKPTAG